MLSTGQIIFAAIFVIAFSIVIVLSYKKDKQLHRKNYKGVKWVGIIFLIFLLFLFSIKYIFKN